MYGGQGAEDPRSNDAVAATLWVESGRHNIKVQDGSEPTDKDVYGAKRITVKIKR